jgi:AcrR family transcriptional regulator
LRDTDPLDHMPQPATATTDQASYRGAVRQLLRDRLLDAARDRLTDRTWAQVTMAEIAGAAGVSRQTLYNEFGNRDEFGQALVIREGSRFLDAVEDAIGEHPDDPLLALKAALERFLTIATTDPFVRLLLNDDGTGGLLPLVTTQSGPVLDWAGHRVAQAIRAHWPQAAAVQADLQTLADSLVRLAISHVTAPRDEPARTASAITNLLAPSIERMLADAQHALES